MSISHITDTLILTSSPSQWKPSPEWSLSSSVDPSKDVLRSLFLTLSPPFSPARVRETLKHLQELENDNNLRKGYDSRGVFDEEQALKDAVLGRLVAGVYAEALDTLLAEAISAEVEAQWWADLERSRLTVAYYLFQTFPLRIFNLFKDPISFSTFKPSSIRDLLRSDTRRLDSITARIFPHLRTHPSLVPPPLTPLGNYSFSTSLRSSPTTPSNIISAFQSLWHTFSLTTQYLLHHVTLPLQLTHQEIHTKRLELERIRDERAETLGELTSRHENLSHALQKDLDGRAEFLQVMNQVLVGQHVPLSTSLLDTLVATSSKVLPMHMSLHQEKIRTYSLLRPNRLVRLWPRLVVLPPLTLYAMQRVSASQDALLSLAEDAWETLKGFWRGWLVEPLADIAKTVRAGGEGSIIVQKGSIEADLQSLERMALSLARDKLSYSQTQLDDLSNKLRIGDLTPILQIYEEDIKSPVRSAVAGTLLRSAFIQVQKAKVDVDQALAGIDKLLRSQELTFAFVGVAPALSLVFVVGGYLGRLYSSSHGRMGGVRRRTATWQAMRRIERLLIAQPHTAEDEHRHAYQAGRRDANGAIPPLTAGLLLLSVSSLRQYAETWLPPRSRLREGFLEDVGYLEDPRLGREEKMRIVERMWRSWGHVLGWQRLTAEVSS
ncbi:NCA2-domain-containing protein [Russula earlei]|uniref:NCA2-domain-containing protein n=1 Tax=Russula earlei TaxID=71964 RepID=A0ACC0TXP5_9AGAM|nr:NCA2-domain-containing protein [Russula earlei]